jgi:enterochelin esterase-like enzyme/outer membrane protein assembly factor BamB
MPRFSSFILILIICLSSAAFASDWQTFRGPNQNGTISDGKFVPPADGALAVAWRSAIGSGYSGIAVSNGRVVTLFSDQDNDVAAAFDATSGKELWRYKIGPKYKGHDGSQDGPIASPVIQDSKVYGVDPYGHMFAVDLATGKEIWSTHIAEKHGAQIPNYGYSNSPVVADGVLILELGGESGKAIAGFDLKTGQPKWTAGDDKINYQSPVLIKAGGKEVVAAVGDTKLFLIDPASGKILVEYPHGGDAAEIVVPVPVENDRLLLRVGRDKSDLIKFVAAADGKLSVEKVWSEGVFKNSYAIPVYYNGYLYGYNSRVLTCVDASNGQLKWRSRTPDDGWLLVVDGNLVVQTKTGSVYVGAASPEGWKEISKIDLFKNLSWSHPVYAAGGVYTRSFGELARLEWRTEKVAASSTPVSVDTSSAFGKFLSDVQSASDKNAVVDKFFAAEKQLPIVESPDHVHFVYRGEATDMAIGGDMIGSLREVPMQRVEGTNVYYYSAQLEPDAQILYRFFKNYDEQIADPNSKNQTVDRRGSPLSIFSMPGFKEPDFINEAPADKKGKTEARELKSSTKEGASAKFTVYLPAKYESSTDRYPVVYLYDGTMALKQGSLVNVLDNLIGTSVKPLIAVMIDDITPGSQPIENEGDDIKARGDFLAKEIVPYVDKNFRTMTDPQNRAVMGPGGEGPTAVYTAFRYPDLFGGLAIQTMFTQERAEAAFKDLIKNANEVPMRVYLDWGIYDSRAPLEGWDTRKESRRWFAIFQDHGYKPAGGEVHQGAGWPNWRNRADRWLSTLFPM